MAWTYANWQTASISKVITAVSTSAGTITVAGHQLDLVATGDRVAIDAGANAGTYTVSGVSYAPDATVVTLSPKPASATVSGNLVLGPNARTRVANLRQHHAEVSAQISASIGADGVSSSSETLRSYLIELQRCLSREQRAAGGLFLAGRLRDA
ncbi:MAG: hypothetical protein RLZZ524_2618 [Pseudomonadota bacterium]